MSESIEHQVLTAVDVVYPSRGEVVRVEAGEVLVFAQDVSGRRLPVTGVPAGGILVGCEDSDGVRMLATGLAGTQVRQVEISEVSQDDMTGWIRLLARCVSGSAAWPNRLIDIDDAGTLVAPGEHIAALQDDQSVWVRLKRGSVSWCGGAAVTVGDPPLPLIEGTWLTADLRCLVGRCEGPSDWTDSLDLVGRLALRTVTERRLRADSRNVARLQARSEASDAASMEAVDIIASAVGGRRVLPVLTDATRAAELSAVLTIAQACGLTVTDSDVERAAAEIEAGRDPIAAVADVCDGRPRALSLRSDWWQREGVPMLVHVATQGSAVRAPAAVLWRRGWVLVDPVTGESRPVDALLAERIGRNAFELLPVLPSQPAGLRDLGRLAFRGSRREIAAVLGVTGLLALMSFITPFLLGQMAKLFVARATNAQYAALFGTLLLVVVAGTTFQAVRSLALLRARSQAAAIAGTALWERIMRQRATWHSRFTLGERATQASAVNNASASMPDEAVTQLLDVSLIVGSLAAIATVNSAMLVSLTALLAVQGIITVVLLRMTARRADQRFTSLAAATSRLLEILAAVNRLRVAGAESRAFLRWAKAQAPFSKADQQMRRVTSWQNVVMSVWPLLTLVIIVVVTDRTNAGFGDFITAQTASSAATLAVASMTLSSNSFLVARESLRQAEPVLESVPEGGAEGSLPGVISGAIEARDLVFRYAADLPPALDHVNLSVRPGEHVAIVGPSGCGKTTLMRVLLGLEEPDSGVIAFDGKDLVSLNQPALRRQIGSVLQSSALLPCSIKDNVDQGRGLTQDQVWAALETAGLAQDVRAMTMGIETPVTDGGGTLSGGQRQRVLIARAMAGNPRMLILDEATSALDNVTQAAVVESLEQLRITRIVVAHRLSTIRHADRIIVMDAGRVVDEGTFDELVSRPGSFAELVERQSL